MKKTYLTIAGVAFIAALIGGYVAGLVSDNQPVSQVELGSGTRMVNGISTDTTSPSAGEVRTTTLTVTGQTTQTGTSTVTQSVDGLVVGGTISTAATGTVRTVYTNTTGPKLCDASTSFLFTNNNGSFAPSLVWSLGTSTSAIASRNLLASTTIATSTDTLTPLIHSTSLFILANNDVLTAIMGDITNTEASSTYFSNWSAEAGVWCMDISI